MQKKAKTKTHNKLALREHRKRQIMTYLCDPNNPPITRSELALKVLGYKQPHAIYVLFTTDELNALEWEALEYKRNQYASKLNAVDIGLLEKAASGDAPAAKLAYQKFEGWSEKTISEHKLSFSAFEGILKALPEEYAEKVKEALLKNK